MNVKKIAIIAAVLAILVVVFVLIDSMLTTQTKYKVTFQSDGHTISIVEVLEGEKVSKPDEPVKDGYTFNFWAIGADEYNFDTQVNSDITLSAKYIRNDNYYTVTFQSDVDDFKVVNVLENQKVLEIIPTPKDGYIFSCWEKDNIPYDFDTQVTSNITLVAKWIEEPIDQNVYIVTFDNLGETTNYRVIENSTVSRIVYSDTETHVFLYWTLNGVEFDFTTPITSDITLVAKWEEIDYSNTVYTIYFYVDDNLIETQEVKHNENAVKPTEPTHEYALFSYWESNGKAFNFDTLIKEDIVLTAYFDFSQYTLSFESDNGIEIQSQTLYLTQKTTQPENPIKEGYDFLYWEFDGEQYFFNNNINDNILLTAKWVLATNETVYYTVSFNSASGTSVLSQSIIEGGLISIPTTTRDHYDFISWKKDGLDFDFNTRVYENIVLTASWQIHSYDVTFDTVDGSYVASQTITRYSTVSKVTTTKYGYNFVRWELDGVEYKFTEQVLEDIHLVAVWDKIIYFNVTFDTAGGGLIDTQEVEKGYAAAMPYTPTKDNYVFAYWMLEGEQYNFSTPITEDIVLTANWVSKEINIITFDVDGGSYIEVELVETLNYLQSPVAPKKDNHLFLYWATEDGKQYDFSTPITSSLTLRAVWYYEAPIIDYTVTFISFDTTYKTVVVNEFDKVPSFTMSTTTTHRFNKWIIANDEDYNFDMQITENITIYAVWDERIYYNVIFDYDNWYFSSQTYVPKTVEHGYTPSMSYNYAKKNLHTFSHWEVNGEVYTFGKVAMYGDLYVTAVWNKIEINLTFNGGTKVYNSSTTSLKVTETLPTGVTVVYENNSLRDVGTYVVLAHIYSEGELYDTLSCTYIITPKDLSIAAAGELVYEHTGSVIEPNAYAVGTGWASTSYYYSKGTFVYSYDRSLVNAGVYTCTVTLMSPTDNTQIHPNYTLTNNTFTIEIIAQRQYNYEYEIVNNEVIITGFFNTLQTELDVVSTIEGYPVTTIKASAFKSYTNLTRVVLPSSVKTIEAYAFQSCTNLTSVTFSGVTTIGTYAFASCSKMTDLNMGSNVSTISSYAFSGCSSLTSLLLSPQIQTIENNAFASCSKITSINFGNSLKTIGNSAFSGCSSLLEVILPNTVTTIGNSTFYGCTKINNLVLSTSLTSIGTYGFYNNDSLTSVFLPSSILTIGESAFEHSGKLISVNIPNKLELISQELFRDCTVLTTVIFDSNSTVKQINNHAFYNTALTSINLPNSLTTMGSSIFGYITELTNVTIPDSVTSLGTSTFYGCTNITTFKLPATLTNIPDSTFYNVKGLTTITIPAQVTSIGGSTFSNCTNVTSVNFAATNKLTSIGASAFYNMSLVSKITLPITVETIGNNAFEGWSQLQSFTIPSATKTLGTGVLKNCIALTAMTIPNTVTSVGTSLFQGCTSLETVMFNPSINNIPGSTFYNCTNLKTVTLPQGLTTINYQAFYGCSSLTSFTIPSTVTTLGYGAFRYCTGLSSIIIPSTVVTITQTSSYASTNATFNNTPDLIIYVSWQQDSKPSGWATYWQNGCKVVYGITT